MPQTDLPLRTKPAFRLALALAPLAAVAMQAADDGILSLRTSGYWQAAPNVSFVPRSDTQERRAWTEYRAQARINLRLDAGERWALHGQTRLRYFGGDFVRSMPGYAENVARDDGLADLSWTVFDNRSGLLHVLPDRLNAEWDGGAWNARAGRQRINWGVNLITNPNDIFNHYSFFDFDYPERPGSDSLRIQRHLGFGSRLEAAVRPARERDETVAALLYAFHAKGYDAQLIAGRYRDLWTAGLGWAGNVGDAGLKGEIMAYAPGNRSFTEDEARTVAAVSLDTMLPNRVFVLAELLYNESGGTQEAGAGFERVAPDNPSFARWQATLRASWPPHPLLDTDLALMIFPEERGGFLAPSATWSVATDTDAMLLAHIFVGRKGTPLADAGWRAILSLKRSF